MIRAILITGATGKQGGATLRALAAADPNLKLLAVTRNTTSASAKSLAAKYPQVTLIQGDLNDTTALFSNAMKATGPSTPIHGVFSVQMPDFNEAGLRAEEKQGKDLVDAAVQHGVKHFVYSSAERGGVEVSDRTPTYVPHFITKYNIEKHLEAVSAKQGQQGMTYTILRPVAFYENLDGGFQGKVFATAWRDVVRSKPLQVISTTDIGKVAAKALLEPSRFAGRALSLAGDELTFGEFDKVFVDVTGRGAPTTWGFMARFVLWMVSELGIMYRWFEEDGFGASVQDSREVLPEIMDFKTWLGEQEGKKKV